MFGHRIKLAREISGLSIDNISRQLEINNSDYKKYEENLSGPNSTILTRLSKITNLPIDFFFMEENSLKIEPFYRKKTKVTKKNILKIENQIKDWIEDYIWLEELLHIKKTPLTFKFNAININNVEEIEDIVIDLRNKLNVGLQPISSMVDLLEDIGFKICFIETGEDFDSCIFHYKDITVIAAKKNSFYCRQRFSLAHELGHFILQINDKRNIEQYANRFAGAFLMPKICAEYEFSQYNSNNYIPIDRLKLLKERYGISIQSMIRRVYDINLIDNFEYQHSFIEFNKVGWKRCEPGDIIIEQKTKFDKMVIDAARKEEISISKASRLLNKSIIEAREIIYGVSIRYECANRSR